MPIPAAGALVPLAAKGAAKLGALGKLKAALGALKGGGGAVHKAYRVLKPVVGRKNARMAGDALHRMGRGLTSKKGFMKNLGEPLSKEELMMTVAPDLLFGGMAAATTEGDLVDKALAGAGSTIGGIAGGLGGRGIFGPKSNLGILGTEMIGGIVGDSAGMSVADAAIRLKNGGMTPAEQRYAEQDAAYQQQIIDEFLAQTGLGLLGLYRTTHSLRV